MGVPESSPTDDHISTWPDHAAVVALDALFVEYSAHRMNALIDGVFYFSVPRAQLARAAMLPYEGEPIRVSKSARYIMDKIRSGGMVACTKRRPGKRFFFMRLARNINEFEFMRWCIAMPLDELVPRHAQ